MNATDLAWKFRPRIRRLTPATFRRTVSRVGHFLAVDVDEIRFPSIEGGLATLRYLGFAPKFCVDVGAYHGDWTQMFKFIFPSARVLMIEAQEGKRSQLAGVAQCLSPDVSVESALLGAEDGNIVSFHQMGTGSSVFPESNPMHRTVVKMQTRTLDRLLSEGSYPEPDMLKLDVQGYELEVLKGASGAMRAAEVVLMETSLIPINEGCPLFSDVILFMNEHQFRLFDFCSQIRRLDGVLWQTDLLFLKSGSPINPAPRLFENRRSAAVT